MTGNIPPAVSAGASVAATTTPAITPPPQPALPPNVIRLIFTKTDFGIPSMLVRWSLPRSRWIWSVSSHVLIDDGTYLYEALPFVGVRKSTRDVALKGSTIVDTVDFVVPDVQMGFAFLESQLGKPYDWMGVLGLGIAPTRDWANGNDWFCYELAAAALKAAGLDVFSNLSHITEIPLLALRPSL